jgi:hypothetical protein
LVCNFSNNNLVKLGNGCSKSVVHKTQHVHEAV